MVLSAAGGSPEVAEDGVSGYIITQNDSAAFERRFRTLLTDSETWQSMQAAAYERLDDRFDPERMVDQYAAALERLAETH
jgi:colanic acid/amylovoran biosynthesis glycosyltransferase